MEKFKQILKKRMAMLLCYNALLIALIIVGLFRPTAGSAEHTLEFMSGLNFGFYVVIQILLARLMVKYLRAIKDSKQLQALYIYENDERRKYIQSQIGGVAINILLASFTIGTIGAGFFNEIVFFTLLGVLFLISIVKGFLKIYFCRKV